MRECEPRLEVLPEAQRVVLQKVGPVADELGFYLAGGTAVALRLGHRVSVDLDWFTPDTEFDPLGLLTTLRERLPDVVQKDIGTGTLHVDLGGVRLTFLRYRYPLLDSLQDMGGFKAASLADLICMKLAAATQRGEKKDFFDIVAICEGGIDLETALEMYRRKFGLASSGHVIISLAYFDDAESDPDPVSLNDLSWDEVKRRLSRRLVALSGS